MFGANRLFAMDAALVAFPFAKSANHCFRAGVLTGRLGVALSCGCYPSRVLPGGLSKFSRCFFLIRSFNFDGVGGFFIFLRSP
jgi:hypothetical protein